MFMFIGKERIAFIPMLINILTASLDGLNSRGYKRKYEEDSIRAHGYKKHLLHKITETECLPECSVDDQIPDSNDLPVCNNEDIQMVNDAGKEQNIEYPKHQERTVENTNYAAENDMDMGQYMDNSITIEPEHSCLRAEVNSQIVWEFVEELKHAVGGEIFEELSPECALIKYLSHLEHHNDADGLNQLPLLKPVSIDHVEWMSIVYLIDKIVTKFDLKFVKAAMPLKLDGRCLYSYTNSQFLSVFLSCPLPLFSADIIRTRLTPMLLYSLGEDQFMEVLITLLRKDLGIKKEERMEFVEAMFGCIDYLSRDKFKFAKGNVMKLVVAVMESDIPSCFEQIYLTWRMWNVFTVPEQDLMLDIVYRKTVSGDKCAIATKYGKEVLVMLYLFLVNRSSPNLCRLGAFRKDVMSTYKKSQKYPDVKLEDILSYKYKIERFLTTFDTRFMYLPEVLKDIITSKPNQYLEIKSYFCCERRVYYGNRYKIHACYALTKFTRKDDLGNLMTYSGENGHNEHRVNVLDTKDNNKNVVTEFFDNFFFDYKQIKNPFRKWSGLKNKKPRKMPTDNEFLQLDEDINEFRNSIGALRQVVHTEGYNPVIFLELFRKIDISDSPDRLFTLILFFFSDEKTLRGTEGIFDWANYEQFTHKRIKKNMDSNI